MYRHLFAIKEGAHLVKYAWSHQTGKSANVLWSQTYLYVIINNY